MKLNKLILTNLKMLLLLPVVPISKKFNICGHKKLKLYYLLFIFIGILSSIIFRFYLVTNA